MKVSVTLRRSRSKNEDIAFLYFRLRDKETDIKAASSITINPEYWDASVPGYAANTPKKVVPIERQQQTNELIQKILNMIKTKYKKGMDAKWLAAALEDCTLKMAETKADDKAALPADEYNGSEEPGLIDYFKMYLERSEFNDWHRQAQTSVLHRLQRYEKWLGYNNGNSDFRLSLELFDKEQVEDYADYMEHEHEYRDANRKFFDQFNIKNEKWIRPISRNGIISGIKRLNMFLNWAVKEGYLTDTSFRNVSLDQQLFGTPYYLTIEERDEVMNFDLSQYPRLERHRDKFIFQCLVGCRSNDLEYFTWQHINGDFLEYIPHKNLLAGRTELVRVPLCDKAKAILEELDPECEYLFRWFSHDLYRQDIKRILKMAGIDRIVMTLNPLTRQAEQRPLYEVAASHLARRTFIGNLYKQVKDPALIASLTGHTENSVSFTRYRAIDDDTKRDILKMIE